jgi:hypothetical protein
MANYTHAKSLPDQWLKLLRYNKTYTGHESEVDYPGYFFAKNGKSDPQAELEASIENFSKATTAFKDINKHPACLFPGRYLYLERIGKIKKKFNLNQCKDFRTFKDKLELKSASIIFSSYFINKPASAFGHTLLKLNKEDPMTSDLKSYGVDFSAQVTTKNPLAYGVMGILGGFYGRFSLMPYFLKLREYNDFESRDLWEFELNLNKSELELLTAHLWDMNQALFDYYYFTENCSYHVTRFIDAIKPEWKLLDSIYKITVPIDTLIPLVKNKTITKGIYFRPSQQKKSESRLNELNNKQIKIVKNSLDQLTVNNLNTLVEKEKVKVLDAIIDFTDYKYPIEMHLSQANQIQDFKREVLILRSSLQQKSNNLDKIKSEEFNFSHKPRKFTIGHRNSDTSGFELRHRFALHDILEPQGGIYSLFSLEMGKTTLFYQNEEEKLVFEEFEIAHVEALRPLSYLEKKISWNFDFGLRNRFEIIAPYLNVGIGPSFELWTQNVSLFLQTENNHPFNERAYQESYLGFNIQWLYKKDNFGIKLNYKNYRDLVLAIDNVEFIQSEVSYLPNMDYQISLNTFKSNNDNRTSILISKYY